MHSPVHDKLSGHQGGLNESCAIIKERGNQLGAWVLTTGIKAWKILYKKVVTVFRRSFNLIRIKQSNRINSK